MLVGMKKINSINWEELKRLNSKYFKNLKRELINLEDTAQYTLGPNVQKLEKEIAKYIGVKYCVAVGTRIGTPKRPFPGGYERQHRFI